mmetsp:Transcript_58939/g.129103  ORF Transcript_58939/g.129103 Transcript_58939/m.129103 type:complete len:209 (+) Transcript_58939:204-830(+)
MRMQNMQKYANRNMPQRKLETKVRNQNCSWFSSVRSNWSTTTSSLRFLMACRVNLFSKLIFAICKLLAGPCSCMQPPTNSSKSIAPFLSTSSSTHSVQTSSVEMPITSMKLASSPAEMASSTSLKLTWLECFLSISVKISLNASTCWAFARICLMVATSLSAVAVSIAVEQNTPVTTFRTTRTARATYRMTKKIASVDTSRRGRSASS